MPGPFVPPGYQLAEQQSVTLDGKVYDVVTGVISIGARTGQRQIIWIDGSYSYRFDAAIRSKLAELTKSKD